MLYKHYQHFATAVLGGLLLHHIAHVLFTIVTRQRCIRIFRCELQPLEKLRCQKGDAYNLRLPEECYRRVCFHVEGKSPDRKSVG